MAGRLEIVTYAYGPHENPPIDPVQLTTDRYAEGYEDPKSQDWIRNRFRLWARGQKKRNS